jgi:HEAT repeat protein
MRDAAIPALLDLLGSEDFYDPLFPGYGQAPSRALSCLQQIGDKRAIIALFEQIGHSDFFNEEKIFTALRAIGEPAKEFLVRIVKSLPVTSDNERAAMALAAFKNDANIAKVCFEQLQQITDWRKDLFFATYLTLACEGLTDDANRAAFCALAQQTGIPKALVNDIRSVAKTWSDNTLSN